MVEVGTLEITGKLENSEIESGFDRMKSGFKEVENQSNQANASLARASRTSSILGKTFVGIGVAGAAAMTALATKSPVVASDLARMEVEMLKLSNTAGRQLKPVFSSISQELMPAIGVALERLNPQIEAMTTFAVNSLSKISEGIANFVPTEEAAEPYRERFGPFAETASAISQSEGTGTFNERRKALIESGPLGFGGLGTLVGIGARVTGNFILDTFEWIMNSINSKETTLSSADGVAR